MQSCRRYIEIVRELRGKDDALIDALFHVMGIYDPSFFMKYGVHIALFGETLFFQGSNEFYNRYLESVQYEPV